MDVSRHDTAHPTGWFALGATAGWLGGFLAESARDTTPSRVNGPEGMLQIWVFSMVLMGGLLTVVFVAWIAIRRRRRPWPSVPFALPLTLGLFQIAPGLIVGALDLPLAYSLIEQYVLVFSVFAGPVLAAEVVTRRARVPVGPRPGNDPDGRAMMKSKEDSS